MRAFTQSGRLIALFSAFAELSRCMPLAGSRAPSDHNQRFEAIRPRETYSVVPIDGGSPTTVQSTTVLVTRTATKDVTVTATPPTSQGDAPTRTVTQTDISIISIQLQTTASPVTVVKTETITQNPATSSATCTGTSSGLTSEPIAEPSTIPFWSTTSLPPSRTPSSSASIFSTTPALSRNSTYTITKSLPPRPTLTNSCSSVSTSTVVSTFSSFLTRITTSGDGQRPTSYPPWNGTI